MPFKGDLRLGGPHDNEARLNGSSDGPSVPPYWTVISGPSWKQASIYITETGNTFINGEIEYYVLADGVGGTFDEPTGNTNSQPDGYEFESFGQQDNYSEFDGVQYYNGTSNFSVAVSDGLGGYRIESRSDSEYIAAGEQVSGAPQYSLTDSTSENPNTMVAFANGKYYYDTLVWDGLGGISMTSGTPFLGGEFYPDGTFVEDASDTYVEVPEFSGNYYFDGNDNRYEWDGNGNIVFRYSGLYPYGTYITNYSDYNYYWNGSGGFYSEYSGSGGGGNGYPPSGEPTGNGSSTPIYVEINYSQYQIGSNDCVEYHDGSGGTYGSCSNNYYSYGTYLTSDGSYSYYSDGTGSYYSEWYDSSGGGGGYSTGPTGNTSSGTNYLYIPEASNNFENGTYYSTEYHDGMGGTYWDTTYSYQPYGYNFTSVVTGYDAEMMQDVYSYYNSDGNGSYYAS